MTDYRINEEELKLIETDDYFRRYPGIAFGKRREAFTNSIRQHPIKECMTRKFIGYLLKAAAIIVVVPFAVVYWLQSKGDHK